MKVTNFHPGGFIRSAPQQNRAEELDSVAGTYRRWDTAGALVESRPLTASEISAAQKADMSALSQGNADALRAKASQAVIANRNYLASPAIPSGTLTTAQLSTFVRALRQQVDMLTRENNAVIRLLTNQLDDTADT